MISTFMSNTFNFNFQKKKCCPLKSENEKCICSWSLFIVETIKVNNIDHIDMAIFVQKFVVMFS